MIKHVSIRVLMEDMTANFTGTEIAKVNFSKDGEMNFSWFIEDSKDSYRMDLEIGLIKSAFAHGTMKQWYTESLYPMTENRWEW